MPDETITNESRYTSGQELPKVDFNYKLPQLSYDTKLKLAEPFDHNGYVWQPANFRHYGIKITPKIKRLRKKLEQAGINTQSAYDAISAFIDSNKVIINPETGDWNLTETINARKNAGMNNSETAQLLLYGRDNYNKLINNYLSEYDSYNNYVKNYENTLANSHIIPSKTFDPVTQRGTSFGDPYKRYTFKSSNPHNDMSYADFSDEMYQSEPGDGSGDTIDPAIMYTIPTSRGEKMQFADELIRNPSLTQKEFFGDDNIYSMIDDWDGSNWHKNRMKKILRDSYWVSPRALHDLKARNVDFDDYVRGGTNTFATRYAAPGLVASAATPYAITGMINTVPTLWNGYRWLNDVTGSLLNKPFRWGAKKLGKNIFGKALGKIGKGIANYGGVDLAIDIPFYYSLGKAAIQGDLSAGEFALYAGPTALFLGRKPLWRGMKWLGKKFAPAIGLGTTALVLGGSSENQKETEK